MDAFWKTDPVTGVYMPDVKCFISGPVPPATFFLLVKPSLTVFFPDVRQYRFFFFLFASVLQILSVSAAWVFFYDDDPAFV